MKVAGWVGMAVTILVLLPLAMVLTVVTVLVPAAVAPIPCGVPADSSTIDSSSSTGIGAGGGVAAGAGVWRAPFAVSYVRTSAYGRRFHPVYGEWRLHTGQDLASAAGRPGTGSAVLAVAAGVVRAAGAQPAWGNIVAVDHGGGVVTRYAHLAYTSRNVGPGVRVDAGEQLGVEGRTGAATGIHLHFQVEIAGRPVDPLPFMAARGAPLTGRPSARLAPPPPQATGVTTISVPASVAGGAGEGGVGFPLPPPGQPRQDSLHNPPLPIPPRVERLYRAAATRYRIPWTLLAGVGMAETGHGRNNATSWAGAQGLMQFMPATFAAMGVDGDRNGRADIRSDADSVFSAANYLTRSGVTHGPAGVRRALRAYNRPAWYTNDVLFYAAAYGGGTVYGDPQHCGSTLTTGGRRLPPLTPGRVAAVLSFAAGRAGGPYVMGANGPRAYDCSSLTQTAYARVGIQMPRTAAAQRSWLAAGNGTRIPPGQERPGDLVFWDSYLGPNQIGHVALVWNPATQTTIEARSSRDGIGHFSYAAGPSRNIFEIWRVANLTESRQRLR